MARTSDYKGYTRTTRVMTSEENFSKGMLYADHPLDEGSVKALVNFDVSGSGESLSPRGGLQTVQEGIASIPYTTNTDYCIHHAGSLYVETRDGDAVLCKYLLYGKASHNEFNLDDSYLSIEHEGQMISTKYMGKAGRKATMQPSLKHIHGMEINNASSRSGIHTSLEGNTYLPILDGGDRYLGRLVPTFSSDLKSFTWEVKKLEPKEVAATQCVNFGYNMLKDDPYEFQNKENFTGRLRLQGIIPKDDFGNIMLSARPGTQINFHLIYEYPAGDLDTGRKYMVQWEMQELNTSKEPIVLQQVRDSDVYTPGDAIIMSTNSTTQKQFTIIAKLYHKEEVDNVVYPSTMVQDIGDSIFLLPEKVISLAFYYLTDDTNISMLNSDTVKYDLTTAIGMCNWQQRLVLWGVQGAKATLFISEINSPDYMPYPNGAEVFPDNIVACIPYMSNLLLFTHSRLYLITMNEDGLSYSSRCIQERLSMTEEDASTITTIQNMVYFKSGNYFYMVVPHSAAGPGELQLAPVTTPIEKALDNFPLTVAEMVDNVYNIGGEKDWDIELVDYCNYLDSSQMRNVYKLKMEADEEVKYLDFVLTYDTKLRLWTTYMWETGPYRMVTYSPSVTQNTIYCHLARQNAVVSADLVQQNKTDPKDSFRLDNEKPRTLLNYQLLDTGYRKHSEHNKKRYREIQFSINNTHSNSLEFYTSFVVDDDTRKPFYTFNTVHNTDPEDPNYGMVHVEREMCEPSLIAGETTLDTTWKVDFSKFPTITLAKVRVKVTGKGYGGSVKIISMNEKPFELLNINWVYRLMNAR